MKNSIAGWCRAMSAIFFALTAPFCLLPGNSVYPVTLDPVTRPHCLRVYSGRVYLLEGGTVAVYDCEDGRLVRKFGRTGEGPGETRGFPTRGNMLRVNDRGVFIDARSKIVWFSRDGKLIREFRKPHSHFVVEPFQDGWITLYRQAGPGGVELTVTRCAIDFTVLSRLSTLRSGTSGFSLFPDSLNFTAAQECFYTEDSRKGFVISQYHADGSLARTLQVQRPPERVSSRDVADAWSELAADPETRQNGGLARVRRMLGIRVPEFFPCIKELSADRAHLFVKTYLRSGGTCEFLVFDHQGRNVGRVNLPATPPDAFDDYLTGRLDRYYAFEGDDYYYLRENEDNETWELQRVKWTDRIHSP